MTGVKGRSGGARSNGGRFISRFSISREASKELSIIARFKRGYNSRFDERAFVEEHLETWIHEMWQEVDAQIQINAKDSIL